MFELIGYTAAGVLFHYIKHFAQAKKANKDFKFIGYWLENLDTTITTLATVAGAVFAADAAGMLNESTAFLIGFTGNSLAGAIGKRNESLMR